MVPFYGWGLIVWKLKNHEGDRLLATTKSPRVPGTHFINLRWKTNSPWSHWVVLNPGLLDWESSVLTSRPLLQLQIQRLYIQTLIICLAKLWDPTSFQDSRGPLQWLILIQQDYLPTYEVDQSWPWDSRFFLWKFSRYNTQLTKYQDQSFTLSDIDGQERKKEGESELQ